MVKTLRQSRCFAGISVYKIRYLGVGISGFLAGMGGLIYILPISTEFTCTVAGYGFLALAVLIFGNWAPLRIAGAKHSSLVS